MKNLRRLKCKYCSSKYVTKNGVNKGSQRFICHTCGHTFIDNQAIPKMHYSTRTVANVLNMYYQGMSFAEIQRSLIQQENIYISRASAYNWVSRFSDLAVKNTDKYKPKVGDIWIADESVIRLDNRKMVDSKDDNLYSSAQKGRWLLFWDVIDVETKFLLSSIVTTTRRTKNSQILLIIEKASKRAGKMPETVVTDKIKSYLNGSKSDYRSKMKHGQSRPFTLKEDPDLIKHFQSIIKGRTRIIRVLKKRNALKKFMNAWIVQYNYFRPNNSLKGRTPAEIAGINFPFRNWEDLIEKPVLAISTKLGQFSNSKLAQKHLSAAGKKELEEPLQTPR